MSMKITVTLGLLNIQMLIEVFDWFPRMSISRYAVLVAETFFVFIL